MFTAENTKDAQLLLLLLYIINGTIKCFGVPLAKHIWLIRLDSYFYKSKLEKYDCIKIYLSNFICDYMKLVEALKHLSLSNPPPPLPMLRVQKFVMAARLRF